MVEGDPPGPLPPVLNLVGSFDSDGLGVDLDEEEALSLLLVGTGCLLRLVDSALVLGVSVDLY